MARGRMISKSLSTSQKFARLFKTLPELAEFAQSLYPLLVSHADDFGRQAGDLFTVRIRVHPASPRTETEFAAALRAMHEVDLIVWYEAGGTRCIQISKFEPHQSGLHKRTRSVFPRPPGGSASFPELPPQVPGDSVATELNGTEQNLDPDQDQDPAGQAPRALARPMPERTTIDKVKPHLRKACHDFIEARPNADVTTYASELSEYLKVMAARIFRVDYNSREIQKIIDAVLGERERRRA